MVKSSYPADEWTMRRRARRASRLGARYFAAIVVGSVAHLLPRRPPDRTAVAVNVAVKWPAGAYAHALCGTF